MNQLTTVIPEHSAPRRAWHVYRVLNATVPFVIVIVAMLGLSLWELRIQDGSRVYLVGENLWASAQKKAAHCLLDYADTNAGSSSRCFSAEIDVLLGG